MKLMIIEARPLTVLGQLKAVWQFRAFYGFLFNEISMKRYKQTMLGLWWLILQPLIPAVFTVIVFTRVVPVETQGAPYPVFFFASYTSWSLFQSTVILMPRAMIWMRGIMRRTYFPKLLVPLAAIGPPLFELLVTFSALIATVVGYRLTTGIWAVQIGWGLALLPVCLVMALTFGVAIGLFLNVVAAFVKDVVYTTPYLVQVLMLLTPLIYPIRFIPEGYRWVLYTLNPMASIVETTRWALTGHGDPPLGFLALAAGMIALLFTLGMKFFVRAEPYVADYL